MQAYDLKIFADYFQFYVQDADTVENFTEAWTDETVAAMFVSRDTAVAIGTARNMDVPVRLEIHPHRPEDADGWDRQHTASLVVRSGRLQVVGCTEYGPDAFVTPVPPGRHSVRASYFALETLSEDGLEGDDRYLIQVWPASAPFSH